MTDDRELETDDLKLVATRLTPDEHQKLRELAKANNRSVSKEIYGLIQEKLADAA